MKNFREKKFLKKLGKVLGCRWLWSALGIAWILYLGLAIYGGPRRVWKIIRYCDVWVPMLQVCIIVLILYQAGMVKDFFRGFARAFARKGKGCSRMELRRSVEAVRCVEKAAVVACIITFLMNIMDMLADGFSANMLGNADMFVTVVSLLTVMMSGDILFTAVLILLLMPVKFRLERMLISYMEEPQDSEAERAEADGQRVYFGLRAMGLTDRESEVARLAGSGMSNREIGKELYIAEGTVKKHMTHILEKAGCADREALAVQVRKL
nr:LuxR C-terminal-related transcriptional regulator [uncultured Acetatifactor sp.]